MMQAWADYLDRLRVGEIEPRAYGRELVRVPRTRRPYPIRAL